MNEDIVRRTFGEGQLIFREGTNTAEVYLIVKGEVEVFRTHKGERLVLAKLGPNSVFGEMALIDNRARSATAVATKVSELIVLSRSGFEKKLREMDPFLRGIFRVLSENVRRLNPPQESTLPPRVDEVQPALAAPAPAKSEGQA